MIDIGSRRLAVAILCLCASCLIAACGSASSGGSSSSSSSTTTTTASAAAGGGGGSGNFSAQRTKLEACLKSHGVTLPSRPPGSGTPGGGASGGGAPGGGAGGGSGTGTGTGTSTTPRRRGFFGAGGAAANPKLAAAFKACGANFGAGGGRGFRGRLSHTAVTKYVTCVRQHGYNLPNPNFSGKGPIFPANIQSNAKFQAASKPCQSLLTPPRGSAPPGGGTGTSTTSGT
jgi:hypothetical protein